MEINSMTGNTISLQEYARQTPQNSEFAGNLKNRGKEILEQAVDVFFKQDRTLQEAKSSVNFLKDLEQAISVCLEKTREQTKVNEKTAIQKMNQINTTRKDLKGQENNDITEKGKLLKRIFLEPEKAQIQIESIPSQSGIMSFLKELHNVIPLFACACMSPGPITESVKTFAREAMHGSLDASSHTRFKADIGGGQISLLKAGAFSGEASGKSDSKTTAEISSDKTTTDERIIPTLMDLESRILGVKSEKGTNAFIQAERYSKEYNNVKGWFGDSLVYNIGFYSRRELDKLEIMPEHVWIPDKIE